MTAAPKNGLNAKTLSIIITFFLGSVFVSYFFFERCQARDDMMERTIEKRQEIITNEIEYKCIDLKERINDNKILIQEVKSDVRKIAEKIK